MAITLSAKKRVRQSERRRLRNTSVKETVRTLIKNYKQALSKKEWDKAQILLTKDIYSKLDRAARQHMIHKNQAARKKSRLAHLLPKNT